MFTTSPADCSALILPDLHALAIQTGFILRKSPKFSAEGFLQSLLSSTVTGLGSSNQIAAELKARVGQSMSRQSLHERFGPSSTAFLLAVCNELMKQRFEPSAEALVKSGITQILIEDASAQAMPKANSDHFPAHGNHHGQTAGVKIDFAYDLLTETVVSHTLEGATTQDKCIGKETMMELKAGSLVLRDMGYFSLAEFDGIEKQEAFWLTRLPLTTGVSFEHGKSLESRLRRRGQDVLDLGVIVGGQKKSCRLIAVRADEKTARSRRAQRRKSAKQRGAKPCQVGLVRDGWHLMLSNLDNEQCRTSQLVKIYRARWAVEIQFRAWKQSMNLSKALNRKSNEHHMIALVLAGMINHQLGMKIAKVIGAQIGRWRLSFEKLYDLIAIDLVKAKSLADLRDFNPDLRHIARDKRARQSPVESAFNSLT
jgi:hypothetical protein